MNLVAACSGRPRLRSALDRHESPRDAGRGKEHRANAADASPADASVRPRPALLVARSAVHLAFLCGLQPRAEHARLGVGSRRDTRWTTPARSFISSGCWRLSRALGAARVPLVQPLHRVLEPLLGTFHFVITVVALLLLFRRFRQRYDLWRNTLACTTALALFGFAFYPLMPPRLLPASTASSTPKVLGSLWSFDSGTMHKISNQYAAMPSLHFAWAMWSTLVLVPMLKRPWARAAVMTYPSSRSSPSSSRQPLLPRTPPAARSCSPRLRRRHAPHRRLRPVAPRLT